MTKKELKTILQSILKKTFPFSNLSKPQVELLQSLETKPIQNVFVIQKGKHRVFRLVFTDKTIKDAGVNKLLENSKSSCKNKFLRDCRKAIQPQIKKYYQSMIASGKVKPMHEKPHVDHLYPFSYLIKDFCLTHQISWITLEVGSSNYEQAIKDFAEYHKKNAKLKIISKTENLKKGNKLI